MTKQAIVIGPFSGGLNNVSDPSAIADTELAECTNFELDLNGSLVARPPMVAQTGPGAAHVRTVGNATFGAESYVIFANGSGVWAQKLSDSSFTLITATNVNPLCCVQYNDKVWIVSSPGSGASGGSWSPTSAFSAVASMPKGGACIIYKERMWICPGFFASTNASRLNYSEIADPTVWSGGTSGFFDIRPGDGSVLMDVVMYNNNLILFKDDSTWALGYDTKPSDAVIINVNPNIGASRHKCVVTYERLIYTLHEGKVYEINNYNYAEITTKVSFDNTVTTGVYTEDMFMSQLGDRLFVRYFDVIYVFGLKTRTWSKWSSASDDLNIIGPFVEHPNAQSVRKIRLYKAGTSLVSPTHIIAIQEKYDSTTVEKNAAGTTQDISCSATTKNFDFGVGYTYKKLAYWGIDVLTTRTIIGTASPITFGLSVSWGDLASSTWNSLGSWISPLSINPDVTTTVAGVSGVTRRFIKNLKGLRFRLAKFRVQLVTTGSTADGPARLYTITAFATAKQYTSRSVS